MAYMHGQQNYNKMPQHPLGVQCSCTINQQCAKHGMNIQWMDFTSKHQGNTTDAIKFGSRAQEVYELQTWFFQTQIYHHARNKQCGCNHHSSTTAFKGHQRRTVTKHQRNQITTDHVLSKHTPANCNNINAKMGQPNNYYNLPCQPWTNKGGGTNSQPTLHAGELTKCARPCEPPSHNQKIVTLHMEPKL